MEKDDLYEEAKRIIIEKNDASVSTLQRHMGLGYTRASRIIGQLERDGVVSGYDITCKRRVL